MSKFTEGLHPRGFGGKFTKKGGGGKKADAPRGYNRKERNQRAKNVASAVRAGGGSKRLAKAVGRGQKDQDKGKVVFAGGQAFKVSGRKAQKSVAATKRANELKKSSKSTAKKTTKKK